MNARLLAILAGLVGVLSLPVTASAQTAACAPGTPSALKLAGLPAQIPFGTDHVFSTAFDNPDWDVTGPVRYTMADAHTGAPFFQRTGAELEDLFIELDLGDGPATVSAQFVQTSLQDVLRSA